jgi:hypothetical protein
MRPIKENLTVLRVAGVASGSPTPPDPWDHNDPLDRSGSRAPHFWLAKDRSMFDEGGKGFTLLDFGARNTATALARIDRPPDGLNAATWC